MSITEETQREMDLWQAEMSQEKIFEFLNRRENLCTAGFILRRQLQMKFPKLVEKAAGLETYADLTKTGNVAWPDKMIKALAKILRETPFEKCSQAALNVEVKQWQNYLSDKANCQRDTAIKLLFALDMDDLTATKFLLANGNELFSLRNPFDYACKICHDCGLTYEDAEDLFNKFTEQRGDLPNSTPQNSDDNFTRLIKSETKDFSGKNIIPAEEIKQQLLAAMLKYKNDFRKSKNEAGYSLQNLKRFKLFLKYLVLMYPTAELFTGQNFLDTVKIATKQDGTPKVPSHLITSMFDSQEIDLPEYAELAEYGGPDLPERGALHRLYNKIPFNKNVLIPLKSLSKTLRSILRAVEKPANAQAVNRDTILLLTYFFITGWKFTSDEIKMQIQETLEADGQNFAEDSPEESLLFALTEVIDALEYGDDEPIKTYIAVLNRMLISFEFTEFYAPFVLDRFILICLLAIDDGQYLMPQVIEESYRLSKEILDRKRIEEDDGI